VKWLIEPEQGSRWSRAQVGRLWTSLADFYIRQGLYEHARDVYEEGLGTVTTVRDFSLIFDTLTQFEETLIAHRLATAGDEDEEEEPPAPDDDGADALLRDDANDIDLRRAPRALDRWLAGAPRPYGARVRMRESGGADAGPEQPPPAPPARVHALAQTGPRARAQAGATGALDGAATGAAEQRHAAPEPAQRARVAQARQAV